MLNELLTLSRHFLLVKNQPYHRYFIRETNLSHRMNILVGPRGVGKTTSLIQCLLDYADGDRFSDKILYLQADHFLVGNHSLYEIVEHFVNHGGEYIAIDEIHKYPNWSMELKSIYDTFNTLKLFASGSSALEIHKGSHDLSRRALVFTMQGLSLREYIELTTGIILPMYSLNQLLSGHEKLSAKVTRLLEAANLKILPLFSKYIQYGYYPYVFDVKRPEFYYMALEQNVHLTIESDLAAIYPDLTGNSIRKIKQLLSFISEAVPFTPNWSKLKSIVDVGDIRTLKNYFKYLEDAGLVRATSKSSNKLSKIESSEKIFLDNTNLLYTLSAQKPNTGTIRETFFLNMLEKDHDISLPQNGDFIVDKNYVFEIGGKNKDSSQIKGLKNAFIVADNIEHGAGKKIPLWLFGFIY